MISLGARFQEELSKLLSARKARIQGEVATEDSEAPILNDDGTPSPRSPVDSGEIEGPVSEEYSTTIAALMVAGGWDRVRACQQEYCTPLQHDYHIV